MCSMEAPSSATHVHVFVEKQLLICFCGSTLVCFSILGSLQGYSQPINYIKNMAKTSKKKKQDVDFKKVKLKVGKRIAKGNVTKTDFTARKILIREANTMKSDPISSLLSSSDCTLSVKLLKLNNLLLSSQLNQPDLITGSLLNVLGRMSCDSDGKLRKEASKCISRALDCLKSNGITLDPSMNILLTHIKCGLTHLDTMIVNDARDLLRVMISKASERMQQQFLEAVIIRLKSRERVLDLDLEAANDVIERFFKTGQVVLSPIPTFEWKTFSGYIPCDVLYKPVISNQFNMTFPKSSAKDSKEDLKELLRKVLKDKVREIQMMFDEELWSMSFEEAKSWVVIFKLLNFLNWRLPSEGKRPYIEIKSSASKSPAKQKTLPIVTKELNRLWSLA